MVYINGVLINFNLWRCLMMCITLINGLVLINAYIGVNHRLQNLLISIIILKIIFKSLKKFLIFKNTITFILLHNIPGLFSIRIKLKTVIKRLQFIIFP